MRLDHIIETTGYYGGHVRVNHPPWCMTFNDSLALQVAFAGSAVIGWPRGCHFAGLPGDLRDVEPPDPISNSVVKCVIADGSVGSPHVRVGHRQALILKKGLRLTSGSLFSILASRKKS